MSGIDNLIDNLNILWIIFLTIFIILIITSFFRKKIPNIFWYSLLSILLIDLVLIGIFQKPPESFDLYRYYVEMDYYRKLDFIQSIKMIFSKANFIWYFILRICAMFFSGKGLVVISILIPFIIFCFILIKTKKKYYLTNMQISLSILTFFSIINFTHLLSGLRNNLAVSILALGFYYIMCENKKRGYIFVISAIFIHPMTIIFLGLFILYKLIMKVKFFEFILLFWTIFIHVILIFIKYIKIPIFELYFIKLQLELEEKFVFDYRIFVLEVIQMIIYLIIMRKLYLVYRQYTSVCDKNLITDSEYKIGKYFYVLLFLIIGSIGMVNIFTRSRFLFAYFLSVIFALKNKYLGLNHQIEHILLFFTIIVNSYYIYYILCNGVFL